MRPWLVAILAATQVAWTQYVTSTGAPVRWNRAEVAVRMDAAGTADVPGDLEFEAISRSMDTWNAVSCPHPLLKDGGRVTGVKPGSGTGQNLLIWWDDPADWSTPGMDHVIALTTLYYDDRSGVAAKFDMEFADFSYRFTVTDAPGLALTDIENTTTHEFGHVLGLDHSTTPDATMYYSASPGDTSKRTLSPDDITGLCAVYFAWPQPAPDSASVVESGLVVEETGVPSSGGGCRTTLGTRPGAMWFAVLATLALLVLARRRDGRRSRPVPWVLIGFLAWIGPGWAWLSTQDGTPLRWNRPEVTISFIAPGTDDLPGDVEFEVLAASMAVWNEVPCSQPRLVPGDVIPVGPGTSGTHTEDAISFARAEFEDLSIIAYTVNDYVGTTGEIVSTFVLFNDRHPFTFLSRVDVDLGSIAVHEFGHVLGLGHSGRIKTTMYPVYYRGTTFARDLHQDDAAGLCELYGEPLPEGWTSSWPWQDPPVQCEDGCEGIPTGLPTLQATYPKYEVSGRSGCSSGSGGSGGAGVAGIGVASLLILSSRVQRWRPPA